MWLAPAASWGALDAGQVELTVLNPRDHAKDRHRTVDDRPYGGGPGMVMMVERSAKRSPTRALNSRRLRWFTPTRKESG